MRGHPVSVMANNRTLRHQHPMRRPTSLGAAGSASGCRACSSTDRRGVRPAFAAARARTGTGPSSFSVRGRGERGHRVRPPVAAERRDPRSPRPEAGDQRVREVATADGGRPAPRPVRESGEGDGDERPPGGGSFALPRSLMDLVQAHGRGPTVPAPAVAGTRAGAGAGVEAGLGAGSRYRASDAGRGRPLTRRAVVGQDAWGNRARGGSWVKNVLARRRAGSSVRTWPGCVPLPSRTPPKRMPM